MKNKPINRSPAGLLARSCRRLTPALIVAIAAMLPVASKATVVDLTTSSQGSIDADVGGVAVFTLSDSKPTGTGVFDPFLRLQANGQTSLGDKNIEQAYNTDGRIGAQAPLDAKSDPNFTHSLQLQDLAVFTHDFGSGSASYYVFELDAHEPDSAKGKLLSLDNIRIYTAPEANGGTATTLNIDDGSLGTLRFALNQPNAVDPNLPGNEPDQWVKFDASHDYSTGSGAADLLVYVPVSDFAGALGTDYVYFYNLNGVHYGADAGLAAEATFEEWRALTGTTSVPDGGSTIALLGSALAGLGFWSQRTRKSAKV